MNADFCSPKKQTKALEVGTKEVGPDGRTWEVVRSKNGEKRWLPVGRKARGLYVRRLIAKTRAPRDPNRPSRPNPSLEWIRANPRKLILLTQGRALKPATNRRELMRQVAVLRDGWEAITTRNQDLSDERIADEPISELKKFVASYTSDEMLALLCKWLAPLLIKALRPVESNGSNFVSEHANT